MTNSQVAGAKNGCGKITVDNLNVFNCNYIIQRLQRKII